MDEHDPLSLEKMRIHERLTTIEGKLDNLIVIHQRHDAVLFGNGREGLIETVRSLKQTEESRRWTLRALVTGLIALIVKPTADLLGWPP